MVDFLQLYLSAEGWPKRDWEQIDDFIGAGYNSNGESVSIYKVERPPEFRLGSGINLSTTSLFGDVLQFEVGAGAEWQGRKNFGAVIKGGFSVGAYLGWMPSLRFRAHLPINNPERDDYVRSSAYGPELSWRLMNYKNMRSEFTVFLDFAADSPSIRNGSPFTNGIAMGLSIVFGSEDNIKSRKPIIYEEYSPPPSLEGKHLIVRRGDLGVGPALSKNAKKIVIFVDRGTWKRLQDEHADLIKRYLASIVKDYDELEKYDVSFDIYVGNWQEVIDSRAQGRVEGWQTEDLRMVEDIQRTMQHHNFYGELLGALMIGEIPHLRVEAEVEDMGGLSDIAYFFPEYDISKAYEKSGVLVVDYDDRKELFKGESMPVGRFPADPFSNDGLDAAVKLIKNAIAYRDGKSGYNGPEVSKKIVAYSLSLNNYTRDNECRKMGRKDVAPGIHFIDPEGENPLQKSKEEFIRALTGDEKNPPAHAVIFGGHGSPAGVSLGESGEKEEGYGAKSISSESFRGKEIDSNFVTFSSCTVALGAYYNFGLIQNMILNGSVVGITAYAGLESMSPIEMLQWAAFIDLELQLPRSFGLRAYQTKFLKPSNPVDPEMATFQYFGDPFVRFLPPMAYRSDIGLKGEKILPPMWKSSTPYTDGLGYQLYVRDLLMRAIEKEDLNSIRVLTPLVERFYVRYPYPLGYDKIYEVFDGCEESSAEPQAYQYDYVTKDTLWRILYPYLIRSGNAPRQLLEELSDDPKRFTNGALLGYAKYYATERKYDEAKRRLEMISGDRDTSWQRPHFFEAIEEVKAYKLLCNLRLGDLDAGFGLMQNVNKPEVVLLNDLLVLEWRLRSARDAQDAIDEIGAKLLDSPLLHERFKDYFRYLRAAHLMTEGKRESAISILDGLSQNINQARILQTDYILPYRLEEIGELIVILKEEIKKGATDKELVEMMF